jgi:hypothetical protein
MMAGSSAARVSLQPDAEACGSRAITATGAGRTRFHGEMQRQCGFTDPAFLRDDRHSLHIEPHVIEVSSD